MADTKRLVASIVAFLRNQMESNTTTPDSAESLEVGIQCLESAFGLTPENSQSPVDLLELFTKHSPAPAEVSEKDKEEAEALKNEGNALMKSEKFLEALQKYTRAIEIDGKNSIFYCNRAASYYYLKDNDAAVKDCYTALSLNPNYARAYGRLGLALTKMNMHLEARDAYEKALRLEPNNEAFKNNLRLTEETLAQTPAPTLPAGLELGSLFQNPALMTVATQMLSDPAMQNLMSGILGNVNGAQTPGGGPDGINALLQAGQQLAQHMQQANPELVEQLRSQMTGPTQPPPPQPPQPPQ